MRDKDYSQSLKFLESFFRDVDGQIELRALPNDNGTGAPRCVFTRDPKVIIQFCQKHDLPGRGVYFGVTTRQMGAHTGSRETLHMAAGLHLDSDTAKHGLNKDDAIETMKGVPLPPTVIVDSGNGLHGYWLLHEQTDIDLKSKHYDSEVAEDLVVAMKRLAAIFAGDSQVAELARIMRLPGTINSKHDPAECKIVWASGARYELSDLQDWLDYQRPLLEAKAAPKAIKEEPTNPFLAAARSLGYQPPIDVQHALETMSYGAGEQGIHNTQLRVTASLASRGLDEDEIVSTVLAATRAAAGEDGASWNWKREEAAIRRMTASAKTKFATEGRATQAEQESMKAAANGDTVVDLNQERSKRKKKVEKEDDTPLWHKVADVTLAYWRERGWDLMATEGELWHYERGFWVTCDPEIEQRLIVAATRACESIGGKPSSRTINEAVGFLRRHEEVYREDVEWDAANILVGKSNALDLETRRILPHSPAHHMRFAIDATFEADAKCPTWITFLERLFDDRPSHRKAGTALLQEFVGAGLVRRKPREMRKALIAHGPSRTGKTQLADVLTALYGHPSCSAKLADLDKPFGLQGFLNVRSWIAEEAIGGNDFMPEERFKTLVTGEQTTVARKNKTDMTLKPDFPIALICNNMPKIRDTSSAIYNRIITLPLTRVWTDDEAVAARPAGYSSISEKIIAEELPGIVLWALDGWDKLKARGRYEVPDFMTETLRELERSNNPVQAFAAECIEASDSTMVHREDLRAAFNAWHRREMGDGQKEWGARAFVPALRMAARVTDYRVNARTEERGERFFAGIRLNDDGIELLRRRKAEAYGTTVGYSTDASSANRSWFQVGPNSTRPTPFRQPGATSDAPAPAPEVSDEPEF